MARSPFGGLGGGPVIDAGQAIAEQERIRQELIRRAVDPNGELSVVEIEQRLDLLAAEAEFKKKYRMLGGNSQYGVLGNHTSQVELVDGEYEQSFEFGSLRTRGNVTVPEDNVSYFADIDLVAIKCFGTEDPGGLFTEAADEPYLIVTAVTPSAAFTLDRPVVSTWKSRTYRDITRGELITGSGPMFRDLRISPSGISLKLALVEHEHGSEEDLRKEITEKGNELARELISAAAVVAGISADEELADQTLDSPVLELLGYLTVTGLTEILKDDLVDEKDWHIDGQMLLDWVDKDQLKDSGVSYPLNVLPESFQTNFPRNNGPEWLFSGGGGSYKVFLKIMPRKVIQTHRPQP